MYTYDLTLSAIKKFDLSFVSGETDEHLVYSQLNDLLWDAVHIT